MSLIVVELEDYVLFFWIFEAKAFYQFVDSKSRKKFLKFFFIVNRPEDLPGEADNVLALMQTGLAC